MARGGGGRAVHGSCVDKRWEAGVVCECSFEADVCVISVHIVSQNIGSSCLVVLM